MTQMQRTLVIMAKAPRPGSVKTRLTKNLPVEEVTALYRCLLNDTIELGQRLDGVNLALMCPIADAEELARAVPETVRIVAQTGNGLAAGLDSVFAQFTGDGTSSAVAFNSDSPHLPRSALESAFAALETCDLVIGPSHDGGYYLVGARAAYPGLFTSNGMGTASALDELLERAAKSQLSVGMLERFYDIDVDADLQQLTDELRRVPEKAPRTAAWLTERQGLDERRIGLAKP